MNPTPYSGTSNTAIARQEEEAVAKAQGTYVPPPQPVVQIADWAKGYYQPTSNANSTTPYLSEADNAFANTGYKEAANSTVPTQQEAYQQQLALRQGEIDAANQTYNVLLNQTRRQNLERTGSAGARQARAGLLGSERGAAIDTSTDVFNQEQVNSVEAQRQAAISAILGNARADAAQLIRDRAAAKKEGYDAYIAEIGRKETKTNTAIAALAQSMVSQGIAIDDKTASDLAKTYGVDKSVLISAYTTAKKKDDADKLAIKKAESDIAKNNMFDISEGQSVYSIDPKTGKPVLLASKAKTYAPKVGTGTGIGIPGTISPAAQNIINLMNQNGGTVDDYVKGSSKDAQALRNQVYAALTGQGGKTESAVTLLKEAKILVDQMKANEDWKQAGYSANFGGQFSTAFGDSKARANTINAILARDNLGLLKGAMSDKDLEFLKAMSSGFSDSTVSEKYAKDTIDRIATKIDKKINATVFSAPTVDNTQVVAPTVGQTSTGIKYKVVQ